MANFYMTLSAEEIAQQTAMLLNDHNQLRKRHTEKTILHSRGAYFVDVVGGRVIGCSAIYRETDEATRQFHLCVHPDFRRQGLGRKLKLASLSRVETPYVYVTIREDNVASINLNISLGFTVVKKEWVGDHHVLTLGRPTDYGYGANQMAAKPTTDQAGATFTAVATQLDPKRLFYTRN